MPNMLQILYKQLLNGVFFNTHKKKIFIRFQCDAIIHLEVVFIGSTPAEPTDAEFIVNYLHLFK